MSNATPSGAEFKQQLRDGAPKMGLFINSHSPTVCEQLGPMPILKSSRTLTNIRFLHVNVIGEPLKSGSFHS